MMERALVHEMLKVHSSGWHSIQQPECQFARLVDGDNVPLTSTGYAVSAANQPRWVEPMVAMGRP